MQEDDKEKEEPKLHVDEDWKKSVAEEKERLRQQEEAQEPRATRGPAGQQSFPAPSVQVFMAGLYTQTLIALGELANPLTNAKEKNAAEAAYLIDTIAMLQDKTEGNLTLEESAYVQNVLTDLRMRYVGSAKGADEQEEGGQAPPQD